MPQSILDSFLNNFYPLLPSFRLPIPKLGQPYASFAGTLCYTKKQINFCFLQPREDNYV